MRISIVGQGSASDFRVSEIGPWSGFFSELSKDHEIVSLKQQSEALISMNVHPSLHKKHIKTIPKNYRFLVLWEPKVTNPWNFKSRYLEDFRLAFSPSNLWSAKLNIETRPFRWPVGEISQHFLSDWKSRSDRIAMFCSNKFSITKGQTYTFRRQCIESLGDSLDLFGPDWGGISSSFRSIGSAIFRSQLNQSEIDLHGLAKFRLQPKNYLGLVNDKDLIASKYRFVLVVENSLDYVSEKLFDVIRVGCIPIYVGPPLSEFGIPSGIAVSSPPDVANLKQAYKRLLSDKELCRHTLEKGRKFLFSPTFQDHINTRVFTNLGRAICKIISDERN